MRQLGFLAAILCLTLWSARVDATLVVQPSDDGHFLASLLLPGFQILDASITGGTITSGTSSAGAFSGGWSAGLGFEEGIMLSTGNVVHAPGPNDNDLVSTILDSPGVAELDELIDTPTFDGTMLEITFLNPTEQKLYFDIIFASDEYQEGVGGSDFGNDVFGLIVPVTRTVIDDTSFSFPIEYEVTAPENVAFVPGTRKPISVNNINCGNPYDPMAGGPGCHLFHNNDPSEGGPFFDIQYDGFTDVLSFGPFYSSPGPHTLTLAIADAGDQVGDSTVFLRSGNVPTAPPFAVPEPSTVALVWSGVFLVARRRRTTS